VRYQIYIDTQSFIQRVGAFLRQREVEHNLMLGLCKELLSENSRYELPPFHCIVETNDGRVLAVALRTPPHHLILSHCDDLRVIPSIVDACLAVGQEIEGVLGMPEQTLRFAEEWRIRSGCGMKLKMRQMLHQLDRVVPPERAVRGKMVAAQANDQALLEYWYAAFQMEVHGTFPVEWFSAKQKEYMSHRLAQKPTFHFLWWAGARPVCWVSFRATTERVVRIAPVYTPPSARGRGYASALVAAVSLTVLERGFSYCSLYTDLANPTSNAIYQRVGYQPLQEIHQYEKNGDR